MSDSAVANRYDELLPHLPLVGRTATVGGGTRILPFLREWLDRDKPFVIDLVINGTMSKIMSDVWRGRSLPLACREAVELKYAEPPEAGQPIDPLAIFRGEIEDVRKKVTIVVNDVFHDFLGRTFKPTDIDLVELTASHLDLVTAADARMKYLVRMATTDRPLNGIKADSRAFGSLSGLFPTSRMPPQYLQIVGGFCHIPMGSPFDRWVPDDGPGNAVHVDQGGFPLILSGEGAGPEATVGTMMKDAFALCPPR